MDRFKLYNCLQTLRNARVTESKIGFTVIKFKTDPATGVYIKCPICGEVEAYGFLRLDVEPLRCNNIPCGYKPDLNTLKNYVRQLEAKSKDTLVDILYKDLKAQKSLQGNGIDYQTVRLIKKDNYTTLYFGVVDDLDLIKVMIIYYRDKEIANIYVEKEYTSEDLLSDFKKLNNLTLKTPSLSFSLNEAGDSSLVCNTYYDTRDNLNNLENKVSNTINTAKKAFKKFNIKRFN